MSAKRVIPRHVPKCSKFFVYLMFIKFFIIIVYLYQKEAQEHQSFLHFQRTHLDIKAVGIKKYPTAKNYERKDWHDYEFIEYEKSRTGNGEQGKPFYLTENEDLERDKALSHQEGFHAAISDAISVNRSLPDTRPRECQKKKYFVELPSTSVIVIFHDEWLSVLLRTIHSIYNRSPKKLLKELILVNDNSSRPELNEPLELYVRENFDNRVKILHLSERKGLIVTRMEGAKIATGEVLIFLDSHIEVNVNWLPPLLEVIAINPMTLATPTIDGVSGKTFEYSHGSGTRGVYDDILWYQWFGLRPQDKLIPDKPYQVPIMLGCAFAIRRDFFNDLGQNDEGLMIWNGEQIELSLKIHLCGGDLVEVPCSRASHFFRGHAHHGLPGIDVAARNFKRVATVWMDEFKEVTFRADPKRFGEADAGDLTKVLMIKEKLNCKPFRYFLENIAPEMYERYYYQQDYPGYFAWGAIGSEEYPEKCIDYMGKYGQQVQLYNCHDRQLKEPQKTQHFKLTWHHKLRIWHKDDCIKDDVWIQFCKYDEEHEYQNWKYDVKTKQLINFRYQKCLSAMENKQNLEMQICDENSKRQKWNWGFINETALARSDEIFYENNTFFGLQ